MRLSPIFVTLALLAGCTPTDPDFDKPCDGGRRTPFVKVGTGATEYVNIGDAGYLGNTDGGLLVNINAKGCNSVWIGLESEGLGPTVLVTYGVTDIATGADLTGTDAGPLFTVVDPVYEPFSTTDQIGGIEADFSAQFCHAATTPIPRPTQEASGQVLGNQVLLWAQVDDQICQRVADGGTAVYVTGFDTSTCIGCISDACSAELSACDEDCIGLQACLDARCTTLSAKASPDETMCQTYCESLYSTSTADALVNLAHCVQTSVCVPPCFDYPFDFKQCSMAQDTGVCSQALAACSNDANCRAYSSCVATCSSLSTCEACATTPSLDGGATDPAAGEMLLEAYDRCIERTCIAPGWLVHL